MRPTARIGLVISIVFLSAGPLPGGATAAGAGDPAWLVGYAEGDITPGPRKVQMAGYGRERYAEGTLAPLRAQVLALRDGRGATGILIAADILEFDRTMVEAIRRTIARKHEIPAAHVILSASHTHWGPATCFHASYGIGGPNVWYMAHLEETILARVDEALGALVPATIAYGAFDFREIGRNRRRPRTGGVDWGPNSAGPYDGHTPILRIRRAASPKQVVLVGHACHPTSSGSIQKWSPDYPGAVRDGLEEKRPETRAVFVQGCGADAKIVHRDPKTGALAFTSDPERSAAAGRKLASAVLAFLESGRFSEVGPRIAGALATGELRFGTPWPREAIERQAYEGSRKSWLTWAARQYIALPIARESYRYDVQIWRLGERLTIFAMEGEICSPWGPMLRAMARTEDAMVIGYANTTSAYIPDRRIVREGGYEGESSHRVYFLPAPFTDAIEDEVSSIARRALAGAESCR